MCQEMNATRLYYCTQHVPMEYIKIVKLPQFEVAPILTTEVLMHNSTVHNVYHVMMTLAYY